VVATVTLTATPNPSSLPPRMELAVTATGTPTVSSVTISRIDADGSTKLVRTSDGGPLQLSGGAASLYDYEVPYGTAVTYSIAEGSAPTTTATLDVVGVWLVHLGTPTLSVPLQFRRGSFKSEDWDIDQGVFPILGRAAPMVITGGARSAPKSSFVVAVSQPEQLAALRNILADGAPLLLNCSPNMGYGIRTDYIAVGAVNVARTWEQIAYPERNVTLNYQVIARPIGGTRAPVTWADIAAKYATWADIPAGTTWAQLVS
jgi:hypothetical protein